MPFLGEMYVRIIICILELFNLKEKEQIKYFYIFYFLKYNNQLFPKWYSTVMVFPKLPKYSIISEARAFFRSMSSLNFFGNHKQSIDINVQENKRSSNRNHWKLW